jgi:predicted house-cleaning noncanonical NTP pyrophosphatase (MazG superfamily)
MTLLTYNKLVRDKIPEIIQKEGKNCTTKTLSNKEYKVELKRKLVEESTELLKTKTNEEMLEELADIYEVIEAILFEEKFDIKDIQEKRVCKNMQKGAFETKTYLQEVQ